MVYLKECIYLQNGAWVECSPMVQETGVQSQVVIPKTQKMVLDATLLNTQHYKVRIKGKVEKGVASSSPPRCCSYWKGSFRVTHRRRSPTLLTTRDPKNTQCAWEEKASYKISKSLKSFEWDQNWCQNFAMERSIYFGIWCQIRTM